MVARIDDVFQSYLESFQASTSAQDSDKSLEPTSQAWALAAKHLMPCSIYARTAPLVPDAATRQAFLDLRNTRTSDKLLSVFIDEVGTSFHMVTEDLQRFYEAWKGAPNLVTALGYFRCVHSWYQGWLRPLSIVGAGSREQHQYSTRFLNCFDNALTPEFPLMMSAVLSHLFALSAESDMLQSSSPAHQHFLHLHETGLLGRYRSIAYRFIYDVIEQRVEQECSGDWSSSQLDRLMFWLKHQVKLWMQQILAPASVPTTAQGSDAQLANGPEATLPPALKLNFAKLDFHLFKTLCDLRINELFDIIVEYPDSLPALKDLKASLACTDDRQLLATSLRQANVKRLLHPGADTKDIIDQYVSTIRCLRLLDPPGVLLTRVAEPIRSYLRSRDDTIRCIMTALIEDGGDLVEELERGEAAQELDEKAGEAEDFSDRHWNPDPLDAPPDFHLNKKSDIIQMLVSIYDSRDVFIKEFQVLLAQSLLDVKDYNADRQIRNVEILKKRFGESSLQVCEVMLKDLADSKRIDQHVHSFAVLNPIHPTVVSKLFWPQLHVAELRVPTQMAALQDSYQKQFSTFKPDKRLQWLPNLGTVEIEVEVQDQLLTLEVTPPQAAVIELFQEKTQWTLDELAERLIGNGDVSMVRNALYYWAKLGVIYESADGHWHEQEDGRSVIGGASTGHQAPIDETPAAFTSVHEQEIEEMRMFWQYIRTMLTNLKSMTCAKLHLMLKRSVPTYAGRTEEQLGVLLSLLREEGLVDKAPGDQWKLARSS